MKLWLDDTKDAPEGWIHCHTVNLAITYCLTGQVTEASLDHDLGDFVEFGGDGIKLLDFIAEYGYWPKDGITIHSGNPVGRDNMQRLIDRYGPYAQG